MIISNSKKHRILLFCFFSQWQEPDSVLCFCWSEESIWLCPPKGLVVGYEKGGGRRVDSASSTSYVQQRSRVRVGSEYSEEFEVGVGVHQGSVLSPLLFIIVLEALSRDFRVGVPWELFFADCDLYFSWGMCWTCQGVEGGIGIQGSSCKHD